jgi:hypothetical protein
MSSVRMQGNIGGTGVITVSSPNTNSDRSIVLPDASGTVLVGTVGASTTNSVTNKIAIQINGTTYYLLASTSGA